MATRKSNTAQKSTTGRRPGRPSNASKAAAVQSQQTMLIDVAIAAASSAVKAAFGLADGGVQTVGVAQPSTSNASASPAQPSTSGNTKRSSATVTSIGKKSPGRKVQADSKATLTREFYDANLKSPNPLNRAEFVAAATEKFGYSKQTANTYVSNIESKHGYKLVSRSDPSKRGQKRGKAKKAA